MQKIVALGDRRSHDVESAGIELAMRSRKSGPNDKSEAKVRVQPDLAVDNRQPPTAPQTLASAG
ncbi:hypothetical protein [Bradyrhizobium sp. AZCC 1693]|uniref:hypothetical protein n=1 Tax=Bradyrhizobium sp. AZCC 1693 TaxID=3117029 RepID=UPI002FF39019